MQVSSTITIDNIAVNRMCELARDALVQTAEALHTQVAQAQVMPRDTGNLQNESTFVDTSMIGYNKVSLVSSTPYARRLYFHPEYNFSRDENIAAGGEWLIPWLNGGMYQDFCADTFRKLYKRLLQGGGTP